MRAVLCAGLLLLAGPARAMTLEEAVRKGWANAPQLDAQHELLSLSLQDRWRRFLPNEPQLTYANNDDYTQEAVGLSETFAFPGKAFAYTRLDDSRAALQRAEWQAKRLDVARNVAQSYLDTSVASALIAYQKQSLLDLEGLARTLRARYEAGQSAQAEVIGVELQIRQLEADLRAQQDHLAVASQKLRALVGGDPGADLDLPEDAPDSLIGELGGESPDALRARAAADLAEASRRLSWWGQLPDLTFGVARNRYPYLPGSPSGHERSWSYGAALTLPILAPVQERVEARRSRSQAVVDRSAAELAALSAESDRREAALEYQRSRARLKEIREKDQPMGEALMDSTLTAYRSGKLGFAELILARKTLSDLRAQDVQLRASIVSARLRCLARCQDQEDRP